MSSFAARIGHSYVGMALRSLAPIRFLGLSPVDALGTDWSEVEITNRFRNDEWPSIEGWYVVSNDGFGNPVGVGQDGVVRCSYIDGAGVVELADSFEAFLGASLESVG